MANSDMKEFGTLIPQDIYDEFREMFPMYGATSWFIRTSLDEFLKKMREHPHAREDVASAIRLMVEQNQGGRAL